MRIHLCVLGRVVVMVRLGAVMMVRVGLGRVVVMVVPRQCELIDAVTQVDDLDPTRPPHRVEVVTGT